MNLINALASALTGILLAGIYGLFFALQRRRVFFLQKNNNIQPLMATSAFFSVLRIITISAILSYLLLSTSLHLILVTIFFLVTWFILIFSHKEMPDGRH